MAALVLYNKMLTFGAYGDKENQNSAGAKESTHFRKDALEAQAPPGRHVGRNDDDRSHRTALLA